VGFVYDGRTVRMDGTFGFEADVKIATVTVLGVGRAPGRVMLEGEAVGGGRVVFDEEAGTLVVHVAASLGRGFVLEVE